MALVAMSVIFVKFVTDALWQHSEIDHEKSIRMIYIH